MKTEYKLTDTPYIPPTEKKENKEESKPKKSKVYKEKVKNSPLDDVVNEILEEKRNRKYVILDYSDDEYINLSDKSRKMWAEMRDEDKLGFDNDELLFVLTFLVSECFLYEQEQKQEIYGVSKYNIGGRRVMSIPYTEYMDYQDRVKNGCFTVSEKNRIMEKLYPLSQSVYRKYVPGDDSFCGPYEREDIREAINLGIARALNSYMAFNEKTKISFSSWAYTCMNNACIDVVRHYDTDKRKIKVVSLDDTGAFDSGRGDSEDKSKNIGDMLSVNAENEDYDDIGKTLDRKAFLEDVFKNMFNEGEEKVIKREIFILKAYFGFLTGDKETFANISRIMNLRVDIVRDNFNKAQERLVRTVFKMGYTADEISDMFL